MMIEFGKRSPGSILQIQQKSEVRGNLIVLHNDVTQMQLDEIIRMRALARDIRRKLHEKELQLRNQLLSGASVEIGLRFSYMQGKRLIVK